MNKRDVVRLVVDHKIPPYVPWNMGFTREARSKLAGHYGGEEQLEEVLDNHFLGLGSGIGFFTEEKPDFYRDVFGVLWDRTVEKDIGMVSGTVLGEPTLKGYDFPDPLDERFFRDIPSRIETHPDRYRIFSIGFSLFERAWALRGMENLLMDFYLNPDFAHSLLDAIADYNIAQAEKAMSFDIDAVYFGDDWGQQNGLIMGIDLWREFIKPRLARMYGAVKARGKRVFIHSCGDVQELFDDLIGLGLDCFNPFQPEVMDTAAILGRYRDRLSFHGGLSTQRTLPYGTPEDVRKETLSLLEEGRKGGYIFAPAHAVEGDVSVENMVAFVETVKSRR